MTDLGGGFFTVEVDLSVPNGCRECGRDQHDLHPAVIPALNVIRRPWARNQAAVKLAADVTVGVLRWAAAEALDESQRPTYTPDEEAALLTFSMFLSREADDIAKGCK